MPLGTKHCRDSQLLHELSHVLLLKSENGPEFVRAPIADYSHASRTYEAWLECTSYPAISVHTDHAIHLRNGESASEIRHGCYARHLQKRDEGSKIVDAIQPSLHIEREAIEPRVALVGTNEQSAQHDHRGRHKAQSTHPASSKHRQRDVPHRDDNVKHYDKNPCDRLYRLGRLGVEHQRSTLRRP